MKVIVAETAAQAEEQRALTASMAKPIDSMALLCEVLNVDFAKWGYDQPFTDQELASLSWQSLRDKVIAKTGKKNPSVRDFVDASGRGQLNDGPVFCGTPTQVADEMEEWFKTAQLLLNEGKLKLHPLRLMPGGFQGVLDGLDLLRNKQISGEKLVYRVP